MERPDRGRQLSYKSSQREAEMKQETQGNCSLLSFQVFNSEDRPNKSNANLLLKMKTFTSRSELYLTVVKTVKVSLSILL